MTGDNGMQLKPLLIQVFFMAGNHELDVDEERSPLHKQIVGFNLMATDVHPASLHYRDSLCAFFPSTIFKLKGLFN